MLDARRPGPAIDVRDQARIVCSRLQPGVEAIGRQRVGPFAGRRALREDGRIAALRCDQPAAVFGGKEEIVHGVLRRGDPQGGGDLHGHGCRAGGGEQVGVEPQELEAPSEAQPLDGQPLHAPARHVRHVEIDDRIHAAQIRPLEVAPCQGTIFELHARQVRPAKIDLPQVER